MSLAVEGFLLIEQQSGESLVERLQAGESSAVDELVNCYSDRLLRVATLVLKDSYLAEDMVQECLYDAVTHMKQFRGDSSIYSWLYTILIRRCRRQQKKKVWNLLSFWPKDKLAMMKDDEPSAHQVVEFKFKRHRLRHAIRMLPDRYREVIALFYYEELTVEEISQISGDPAGTIKSRLHRARQKLEHLLGEEEDQ